MVTKVCKSLLLLIAITFMICGIFSVAFSFYAYSAQAQTVGKWWYSSDPSRVSVDPSTGAMTALYPGLVQVCSQPSQIVKVPTQCFTVILTQVVK